MSLQEARRKLLEARVHSNHWANEAKYQEGLIKLLEAQLEDQTIVGSYIPSCTAGTLSSNQ